MHEMSLLADILRKIESIARQNKVDQVLKVRIKLGALSHISPEHFREHFEAAAPGTPAAGAKLEIEALTDINDPHAQKIILDSVELPSE
ncbi:MAG: hydrogenase/urease maturation nickel metallochaperone HypA [bacterium]